MPPIDGDDASSQLSALTARIKACRICRDAPSGKRLPHEPRPLLQVSATARIGIVGQAPGNRAHQIGRSFDDPSGERLRSWMGIDRETFYDPARIAIAAMGFCFPGLDDTGGDLPPRPECALAWRAPLFALMPQLRLLLLVGRHAQRWHMGERCRTTLQATMADWRSGAANSSDAGELLMLPLPHPSWRNNAWLRRHPWFEEAVLPQLRMDVARLLP